jgi:hypothetical protein
MIRSWHGDGEESITSGTGVEATFIHGQEVMQIPSFQAFLTLAIRLALRGWNLDALLCGLSPPVSPRRNWFARYTFWPLG